MPSGSSTSHAVHTTLTRRDGASVIPIGMSYPRVLLARKARHSHYLALVYLIIGFNSRANARKNILQAFASKDCPNVPDGWEPAAVCPKAAHSLASFQDGKVHWNSTFRDFHITPRWGNALSSYWQSCAVASLAGLGFETRGYERHWLQYLPKSMPANMCPQPRLLSEMCSVCPEPESWLYAHRCQGAWSHIRPTIMDETHGAFQTWSAAHHYQLPSYSPGDVVIQSRCAHDTFLSHYAYGPVAFSYYDYIPPGTKKIFIVTDLVERLPVCKQLHDAQVKYLQQKHPDANVTVVGGVLHEDFARLMFAPILFKDASSSFGLWAAMANKGSVWSTPLLARYSSHNLTHYLGTKWHWSTAPVLYPHTAAKLGLTLGKMDAIIQWLEQH